MKCSTTLSLTLFFVFTSTVLGHPSHSANARRNGRRAVRSTSILNNPDAQPDLPTVSQAEAAAAAVDLNLDDIQGDILVGMKKKKELFFFFGITDAATFKKKLATDIHPLITSTTALLDVATQPITAMNIAFSQSGLSTLGITDNLGDNAFAQGQAADALNLLDPGTGNWVPGFVGTSVHGVFLLASDTIDNVNDLLDDIQASLGGAITEIHRLQGAARPGDQEGHEHFGYMDGVSQPAVQGFTASPLPGQSVLPAGEFLLGEDGDSVSRPSWAKDGSFLVFRQMEQLVPEFNKFLLDHSISEPGILTQQEGAELMGARMVGRWKSGAPIDLAPLFDDPVLASDPSRNNNFTFLHDGEGTQNQTRCPFSAHIRKTRPRGDFSPANTANHIIRAGIPYGPEVSDEEAASNTTDTSIERGLAFVAYQSNLNSGFRFLQQAWVNSANFFFGAPAPPGVDPIIGSAGSDPNSRSRPIAGLDPTDPSATITLDIDFVVSRGGEYFFSPSISAILNTIAA